MLVMVVVLFLAGSFAPLSQGLSVDLYNGFDKGPSKLSVISTEKITMVNYDPDTLIDDYAYLASVPTAAFQYEDKIVSHPLLFYQDKFILNEEKERSLNARAGIDYFMDDWMAYCNDEMDKITTINVDESGMDDNWNAKKRTEIDSNSAYEIANELALDEWSTSENAVISVIEKDFEESEYSVENELSGEISPKNIKYEHFEVPQTNQLDPIYNEFEVPTGYKYLKARVWYPSVYYQMDLGGFQQLANITIPSGDKDFQLYCKYDGDWMQTSAVCEWNQKFGMDKEIVNTYVYSEGSWRVSITDIPTKGEFGKYGTWYEIFKNLIKDVTYQVDIELYPGTELIIPDLSPYGCKNASFKLEWGNPNLKLGFALIGVAGEEILSSFNESHDDYQEMHLDQLGECLDGENYKICVFSKNDVSNPIDFTISYSWKQGITKEKGDSLTSATEGAVLASKLNAPMLYVSKEGITQETKDVLYKLGVKNIYIVDFGKNIKTQTLDEIKKISKVVKHFTILEDFYKYMQEEEGSVDVIFTTLDPWTYWYVAEDKPAGEQKEGLFIGPAAYIAAHHCSPVIIIDNHPELSSAIVWHNEFWKRAAVSPNGHEPSVANMYLTGRRVYDFLRANGFDQIDRETIISVADQFDISPSWDRMFVGMAEPGKFMFSPIDTTYWISRNMFYYGLIFENPAMNPSGVALINGSSSERRTLLARGSFGLKITKESGEEEFKFPAQITLVSYQHRFNERANEKYYQFKYQCADGIVPGETRTFEPIDEGSIKKYSGKDGCFWPDMSLSDVLPFYMQKGGFDCAYGSAFLPTVNNLNEGVLYWHLGSHGGNSNSGLFLFWDAKREGAEIGCNGIPLPPGAGAKKETNPWRAYDWYLGSTEEPDTLSAEIHGIIPAIIGNPNINGIGRTALDWAPAKKPLRDLINNFLVKVPVVNRVLSDGRLDTQDYYDGQICGAFISTMGYSWYTGWALDDALENLHSMVFVSGVCLAGTKYMHTAMVRHGSVCQVIDPWSTSWYGCVWMQSVPRDIILGDTMGEAYNKGISHVGIIHIGDNNNKQQWWWDNYQNVIYYGDPDLRMFVPSTEYSDKNHWEQEDTIPIKYDAELNLAGHMPFGVTSYPNAREKQDMFFGLPLWFVVLVVFIILFIIVIAFMGCKKGRKKK